MSEYESTNKVLSDLNHLEFLLDELLKAYVREKFIPPTRPCEIGTENFEEAFMQVEHEDKFFCAWGAIRFILSQFRWRYIMWVYHRDQDHEKPNIRRKQMKGFINNIRRAIDQMNVIMDVDFWASGIKTYLDSLEKSI